MTGKEALPLMVKRCSSVKDYAKSLASYVDKKTSILREIREIFLSIYKSGGLYTADGVSIDEEVFPRDYWYVPIAVTPTTINGVTNPDGYDSMFVTGLEFAKCINGHISEDDMDQAHIEFSKADYVDTVKNLCEHLCDNYTDFANGVVDNIDLILPYPVIINDAYFQANEIINIRSVDKENWETAIVTRDPDSYPIMTISILNTLSELSDTTNSNVISTLALDLLGKKDTVSMADLTSAVMAKLGDAYTNAIANSAQLCALATDESIPVEDRIVSISSMLMEEAQEIEDGDSENIYDDNETHASFINKDYTGTATSAMWSAATAGAAIKSAFNVVGKVLKAAAKVVINVIKSVGRSISRLWKKFIQPAYQSKDFVKAEGTTNENYVDVPIVQLGTIDIGPTFDKSTLANMIHSSISSQVKTTVKFSHVRKVTLGTNNTPQVKTTPSDGFTAAVEITDSSILRGGSARINFNVSYHDGHDFRTSNVSADSREMCVVKEESSRSPGLVISEVSRRMGVTFDQAVTLPSSGKVTVFAFNYNGNVYVEWNSTPRLNPSPQGNVPTAVFSGVSLKTSYPTAGHGQTYISVGSSSWTSSLKSYRGYLNLEFADGASARIYVAVRGNVSNRIGTWSISSVYSSDGYYLSKLNDTTYGYDRQASVKVVTNVVITTNAGELTLNGNDFTLTVGRDMFTGTLSMNVDGTVVISDIQSKLLGIQASHGEFSQSFTRDVDYGYGNYTVVETYRSNLDASLWRTHTYRVRNDTLAISEESIRLSPVAVYAPGGQLRSQWTSEVGDGEVYSTPIESLSVGTVVNMIESVQNPIDKGCAVVFRYVFGDIQILRSKDDQMRMTLYACPIDHNKILTSNGELLIKYDGTQWLWDATPMTEEAVFSKFLDSIQASQQAYSYEEGDLLAYQDLYAAERVFDLYLWLLTHATTEIGEYFNTSAFKVIMDKSYKRSGEVTNNDLVRLLYGTDTTPSISPENQMAILYMLMYNVASNKAEYMRVYYLLYGQFPEFFPYIVGDRLNAPLWHISTDTEIQDYVDKVCQAVIVAVLVIAAVVVVGTVALKIKKALRKKLVINQQREWNDFSKGQELAKAKDNNDNEIARIEKVIKEGNLDDNELGRLQDQLSRLQENGLSISSAISNQNKISYKHSRANARWTALAKVFGVGAATSAGAGAINEVVNAATAASSSDVSIDGTLHAINSSMSNIEAQSSLTNQAIMQNSELITSNSQEMIAIVGSKLTELMNKNKKDPVVVNWSR